MVHLSATWKEGLLLTCGAITISHSSIVSGNFTICFIICLYIYVCKIGETLIKIMLCFDSIYFKESSLYTHINIAMISSKIISVYKIRSGETNINCKMKLSCGVV